MSSGSSSISRASETSPRNVRTVLVTRTGNWWRPEPGDGLAELGDGVVVVDHRTVTGAPGRGQLHPGDALLGRLDEVEPQVVGDGQREAAHLADRLGAAVEHLRVVVDQPVGTEASARLLVGEEGEHQVAGRAPSRPHPVADDGEDHRVHVLHVDRAAAPDAAVGDLAGERVDLPLLGHGRHDVEVAVDEERVVSSDPSPRSVRPRWPGREPTRRARHGHRRRRAAPARTPLRPAPPVRSRLHELTLGILIRSRQISTTSSSGAGAMAPSCR